MSPTPAQRARMDQFFAEANTEVDGLIEGARNMREQNPDASRDERLTAMAGIAGQDLPKTREVADLLFWFVIAIDRLAANS